MGTFVDLRQGKLWTFETKG